MTERENYLRCVRFQGPEWIPCSLGTLPAVWKRHRMDLVQLALEYPEFFGPINPAGWDFDEMGFRYAQGRDETDNWGVVWRNQHEGVVGLPWVHPLADLKALATYQAPDPLTMDPLVGPRDFVAEAESFRQAQAEGRPAGGAGGLDPGGGHALEGRVVGGQRAHVFLAVEEAAAHAAHEQRVDAGSLGILDGRQGGLREKIPHR